MLRATVDVPLVVVEEVATLATLAAATATARMATATVAL